MQVPNLGGLAFVILAIICAIAAAFIMAWRLRAVRIPTTWLRGQLMVPVIIGYGMILTIGCAVVLWGIAWLVGACIPEVYYFEERYAPSSTLILLINVPIEILLLWRIIKNILAKRWFRLALLVLLFLPETLFLLCCIDPYAGDSILWRIQTLPYSFGIISDFTDNLVPFIVVLVFPFVAGFLCWLTMKVINGFLSIVSNRLVPAIPTPDKAWTLQKLFLFRGETYSYIFRFAMALVVAFITAIILMVIGYIAISAIFVALCGIFSGSYLNVVGIVFVAFGLVIVFYTRKFTVAEWIFLAIYMAAAAIIGFYGFEIFSMIYTVIENPDQFIAALDFADVAQKMVSEYGLIAACVVIGLPLAGFIVFALLYMLVALTLNLTERVVSYFYGVKNPCPQCHRPTEPAIYLSHGKHKLPKGVHLRPGVYGLLHIVHPATGQKMPTMLFNGRDKLSRLCPHCGARIRAQHGSERHVVIVGPPESGKSVLTFRFVAELIRRGGDAVKFTDERNSVVNYNEVLKQIRQIANAGYVALSALPQKTIEDQLRSMQLIIKRKNAIVNYRLFINDLAGERFDALTRGNDTDENLDFFRDVNSLLIIIDPFTMRLEPANDAVREWISRNVMLSPEMMMNPMHLISALSHAFESRGVDRNRLTINFLLVKADSGYIPKEVNLDSEDELRRFISVDLSLAPFVHWASQSSSVRFFAVSAMEKEPTARMIYFTEQLLHQLDIQI